MQIKTRNVPNITSFGIDWGQKEKGMTEWDGWTDSNGHEFEQTRGDSEGQGSLECCGSQGRKEKNTT